MEYQFSEHAKNMFDERNIKDNWVVTALNEPDDVKYENDGTVHYIKQINEYKGMHLRVIINKDVLPVRIITLFFDRRIK